MGGWVCTELLQVHLLPLFVIPDPTKEPRPLNVRKVGLELCKLWVQICSRSVSFEETFEAGINYLQVGASDSL